MQTGAQPNILLILADQATWSMICGRSPARTPNLDRLAASGLLFDRSYTPVAVCCPARAMLATGAYPWHNGVFNQVHVPQTLNPDLRDDAVTYAQRLADAGYRTGYLGKWHASHVRGPLDLGYHEYGAAHGSGEYLARYELPAEDHYEQPDASMFSDQQLVRWPGSQPFGFWAVDDRLPTATYAHFLADRAGRMVSEFAANRDSSGQPWLAEVHFPEPHNPYRPLREYLERYPVDQVELPRSYFLETFAGKPGMHAREARLWSDLDEDDFREGLRHYYAYCEQLDQCIGRVIDGLESTGQAHNTLVVFGSDHGDLVGAHRMFLKGWMPYEEAHRIPMIARWPAVIAPGGHADALVQLHDWAHTFVAVGGAEPLPYMDGKNLLPILDDPRATGPDSILNVYYGAEFLYTQRILIGQRHKYVFNGFDEDEFYDLERDPDELHNVIDHPAYQAAVGSARAQLWRQMGELDDPYGSNRVGAARYLPGGAD